MAHTSDKLTSMPVHQPMLTVCMHASEQGSGWTSQFRRACLAFKAVKCISKMDVPALALASLYSSELHQKRRR